jgi:predicted nucleic acid-binding protein
MIFVDTNVLLDVVTADPAWEEWSQQQLDAAALCDRLAISPVVYAELSAAYVRVEELDDFIAGTAIDVIEPSKQALFLAGKAFQAYRRRGGIRTGVLSDFFIGAQAAVVGAPLITRDARQYRSYFPMVELVTPE